MPKRLTTEEFIQRAIEVHGTTYDYTNTVYCGSKNEITYTCPVHGEVNQLANSHLQGKGCGWCAGKRKMLPEIVKQKIEKVHGTTYSYGRTDYGDIDALTTITCPIHGDFQQSLRNHLKGKGCTECGLQKAQNSRRLSTDEFIEKAKAIHGDKYDYRRVEYVNAETPVTIVCAEHGTFRQSPHSHLKGSGCRKCANKAISLSIKVNGSTGWSYTEWEEQGRKSKNFKGFSLYIIECISKTERFIKVGKTFTDIGVRFSHLPYKFKVITQVYHNAYAISKLEEKVHKKLKEYRITPKKDFNGKTECYVLDALEEAVSIAEG